MISPENIPVPEEFKEMAKSLFGPEESEALLKTLDGTESPVSIRLNPRKRTVGTVYEGMTPVPWCADGFYLPERPAFTLNPLLHAGVFYVQEAASMIHGWIVSRLGLRQGSKAVDLCAAPGGKTGAVTDMLPEGSIMVANEFVGQRAQILKENMAKQGAPDVIVTNCDVATIGRLGPTFDLMIADVPCSGEGMMRKEEVARTQWSPRFTESCMALQREILEDALPALKPGGWLIYSTCTFNTLENEENVRWLTEQHGLENIALDYPGEWNITPALMPDVSAMRFLPHKTKGEGLFVALLRKPLDAPEEPATVFERGLRPDRKKRTGRNERGKGTTGKNIAVDPETARGWVRGEDIKLTASADGSVRAMSGTAYELAEALKRAGARIISAGTEVGVIKGKELAPAAPLALSSVMNPDAFPTVELTVEDALNYLRHETLRLPESVPRGYVVVTFGGLPLGFVKNIGSRANNLYPAEWRIRMRT